LLNTSQSNVFVSNQFVLDPGGGQMALATTPGGVLDVALDGGSTVSVDPEAGLTYAQFMTGSASSPWSVYYNTPTGLLERFLGSAPSPQLLVDGGISYIASISHDGTQVVVASKVGSDLGLVSALQPGVVQPVASRADPAYHNLPVVVHNLSDRGFTSDDKYVLFFSDIAYSNENDALGYVHAMAVAPPNGVQVLSTGFSLVLGTTPLSGSRVFMFDNFQEGDGGTGSYPTVDLAVIDTATSTPRKVIASNVPIEIPMLTIGTAGVGVTPDGTQVVYPQLGAAPGLYVAPLQ
jgi:hypothetical protein